MNKDYQKLVHIARTKVIHAVDLVEASLRKLPPYEPGKITTADEQEPYDALSDRFMRAVEISIKLFYDLIMDEFAQELLRLKCTVQAMDIENQ